MLAIMVSAGPAVDGVDMKIDIALVNLEGLIGLIWETARCLGLMWCSNGEVNVSAREDCVQSTGFYWLQGLQPVVLAP